MRRVTHLLIAAFLAAPAVLGAQNRYACSRDAMRSNSHQILTHTNTGKNGHDRIEHYDLRADRCRHFALVGDVRVADDLSDVVAVPSGASVEVHEITRTAARHFTVRNDGGAVTRQYSVGGREATFDATGRAWLNDMLTHLARRSGHDAERRVVEIRGRGGLGVVMQEIAQLESDGARRKYYAALIASDPALSSEELGRVVQQAARDIDSDGDLRSVTAAAMARGQRLPPEALQAALTSIDSDGDRRAMLAQALRRGDRATVLMAVRTAARIDSDGDKSSLLATAAPLVLRTDDTGMRDAFFASAATIDSDGDLRRVLSTAFRAAPTAAVAEQVIATSARLDSDGDKAAVLVEVARSGLPRAAGRLREAYLKVARSIDSDGDYRRAIDAVMP